MRIGEIECSMDELERKAVRFVDLYPGRLIPIEVEENGKLVKKCPVCGNTLPQSAKLVKEENGLIGCDYCAIFICS